MHKGKITKQKRFVIMVSWGLYSKTSIFNKTTFKSSLLLKIDLQNTQTLQLY